MSLLQRVLLSVKPQVHEIKRFKSKINIKKPRAPHFRRQVVLDLCRPIYPSKWELPIEQQCTLGKKNYPHIEIDNPFETILAKECLNWFNHSRMVGFIHLNPAMRSERDEVFAALKMEQMHLRFYGKKIVKMAVTGTPYEAVLKLFETHSNVIFSETVQVGKMIKILKRIPQMVLMAGIVNGRLMSKNELVSYSKLPSLDILRSQLCQVMQSSASNVVSQLTLHQSTLVGHLDSYAKIKQEEEEK